MLSFQTGYVSSSYIHCGHLPSTLSSHLSMWTTSSLCWSHSGICPSSSHDGMLSSNLLIPSLEDDFLQINQPIREHVMTLKPLGQCVHFRKPDWRALQTTWFCDVSWNVAESIHFGGLKRLSFSQAGGTDLNQAGKSSLSSQYGGATSLSESIGHVPPNNINLRVGRCF